MKSLYEGKSVSNIFKKYISNLIPKKQTNIFYTLFNGIDNLFSLIEYKLNFFKRESNILTAENVASLRSLAAKNGFEPKLRVPTKGNIKILINTSLFNRVGYPIYLPPYSVFINKENNLEYYYEADKMLRIDKNETIIQLVEGVIKNEQYLSGNVSKNHIERIYLKTRALAENSIVITVNNENYERVKSFYDNNGSFNDKQFLVKYSNRPETPIILYIKGTKQNDIINVTYREASGEYGNLNYKTIFECQEFLDSNNNAINVDETEIKIFNVNGFSFGSDGSDVNSLKSAIGFNHGVNLLFDKLSYTNFLNKYSTLLLQKIDLLGDTKAIKNIFISKKIYLNPELKIETEYKNSINKKEYLFSNIEINELQKLLEDNEHALSSSVINNSNIIKYAFQIKFFVDDLILVNNHKTNISKLLYYEFSKFFYDRNYKFNIEIFFNKYMTENNINIEYFVFNSENKFIVNDNTTIFHEDKLPIIKGDFQILTDNPLEPLLLYSDINWVIK